MSDVVFGFVSPVSLTRIACPKRKVRPSSLVVRHARSHFLCVIEEIFSAKGIVTTWSICTAIRNMCVSCKHVICECLPNRLCIFQVPTSNDITTNFSCKQSNCTTAILPNRRAYFFSLSLHFRLGTATSDHTKPDPIFRCSTCNSLTYQPQ